MLTSVVVTYKDSDTKLIRYILGELKTNYNADVKRITIGQLFNKKVASIIVQENEIQNIMDMLVANDITIFPFNEEYKRMIKLTNTRINGKDSKLKEKLRVRIHRSELLELFDSGMYLPTEKRKHLDDKSKSEINTKLQSALINLDKRPCKNDSIEKMGQEGNYLALRAMIKKNPLNSQEAKDKYVPAIKNCITLQLEKVKNNPAFVGEAIAKLEEIICDNEIKEAITEDLINIAGSALMVVCSEFKPEELIDIINLPKVGQKINVMAAVKLSELIYENEIPDDVDENLLKLGAEKINIRFLLSSYDVMEAVIADVNKTRFLKLINAIEQMKN